MSIWQRFRLGRIGHWPPEIAVSSWSVRRLLENRELELKDFPNMVKKKFKLRSVELVINHLVDDDEKTCRHLQEIVSSLDMKIICLAIDNDFTVSGIELDRECARARENIKKASILGAQIVRLNPGMRGESSEEKMISNVVEGIKRILPVAKEHRILLALENHGIFGMNADNILKVVKLVKSSRWVGVCLDYGNFFPEELDLGAQKLTPWAVHVHAKAYKFDRDGQETKIDYLARIKALKEDRYCGYLSVEWEGPDNADEIENTMQTIKLIQYCLNAAG